MVPKLMNKKRALRCYGKFSVLSLLSRSASHSRLPKINNELMEMNLTNKVHLGGICEEKKFLVR